MNFRSVWGWNKEEAVFDYPALMENEWFYAYFLRYHQYSGNDRPIDTYQMFCPESKTFRHYLFPENVCRISGLLNVDVSDFIRNYTTIPFFEAFVSSEQYAESQKLIYQGKKYWQFLCRGIADKGWSPEISYCPVCLREAGDFAGIRRYHQISGVHVCHVHGCRLERISLKDQRLWNGNFAGLLVPERSCEDILLTSVARSVWYLMEQETTLNGTVLVQRLKKLCGGRKPYLYNQREAIPKEYQMFVDCFSSGRLFSFPRKHAVYPAEYLLLISLFYEDIADFLSGTQELSLDETKIEYLAAYI